MHHIEVYSNMMGPNKIQCNAMHRITLYHLYNEVENNTVFYIELLYTTFHYIALQKSKKRYMVWCCIALHHITLHYITTSQITTHIALHHITSYYKTAPYGIIQFAIVIATRHATLQKHDRSCRDTLRQKLQYWIVKHEQDQT